MQNRIEDRAGRAICPRAWALSAVFAAALVLAACQHEGTSTPVVSLEEAKQITTTFSGSFTPPPKSVNDIVVAVDKGRLKPMSCETSPTLTDEEVRAMMLSLPAGTKKGGRARFAESQADRHFERGNYRRAIKFMNWTLAATPDRQRGGLAGRNAKLAAYHAFAGDFEVADKALSRAQDYAAGLNPGSWGRPQSTAWYNFHLNEGRAAVAESTGDLVRAEAYYVRAIKATERFRIGGSAVEYAQLALARNLMRQGRLVEAEDAARGAFRYQLEYIVRSPLVGAGVIRLGPGAGRVPA